MGVGSSANVPTATGQHYNIQSATAGTINCDIEIHDTAITDFLLSRLSSVDFAYTIHVAEDAMT